MKRMLKVLSVFAVVCLLAVSMLCTVIAADSKSAATEIAKAVDSDGADVAVTVEEVESSIPPLTAEIAAEAIDGATADELTVVWQKEVKAEKLPVTITFNASGVADDQEVYIFHYEGAWNLVASGKGSSITATFDSLSPVGLVTRKIATTPGEDGGESPKTGETDLLLFAACVAIVLGGAAAMLSYKKRFN